jgi:hypothetical protein
MSNGKEKVGERSGHIDVAKLEPTKPFDPPPQKKVGAEMHPAGKKKGKAPSLISSAGVKTGKELESVDGPHLQNSQSGTCVLKLPSISKGVLSSTKVEYTRQTVPRLW